MLAGAAKRKKRSWFIVHRKELLEQSVKTFVEAADLHTGIIAAGYPTVPHAPVQVCSVASLKRRAHLFSAPDLLVIDECFVAGTLIDGRPIESIASGDFVTTWNCSSGRFEPRRVVGIHRRQAPRRLYRIKVGDLVIICTENHPFLSKRGWLSAGQISKGEFLHGLCPLRREHQEESQPSAAMRAVLSRINGGTEPSRRSRTHAQDESDEARRNHGEGERNVKENRPQADYSWRQWLGGFCASGVTRLCAWLEHGNSRRREKRASARIGNVLQNRHRQSAPDDRHRSGRRIAHALGAPSSRQEESGVPIFRRVDRVEVLEQGRDGRFEQVCRDGFVYNFETEGTHTYVANGLTVHNCHHQASRTWSDVAAMFPRAVHIGLAPFFDELICGPSTADLIAQGYLSPYTLYAPPKAVDFSKVHRVAGDFNKAEVDEELKGSTVVGDCVSHYQQHCPESRALVFAWSLEASRRIAEQFTAAGIEAAHVDGETPPFERKRSMDGFRAGHIRVLTNVDLFGEGLDVPAVDAVFLLRPTQSLGLYLQQVGRGLRPSPGKERVMIFDHVNNWERHGLPDDTREWTLEGREKRSRDSTAMGRRCGKCFGVSPIGCLACRYCGHVFPVQERKIEEVAGDLKAMDVEALRAHRAKWMAEIKNCRTEKDYKRVGKALGYKPGWAFHMTYRKMAQEIEMAHLADE